MRKTGIIVATCIVALASIVIFNIFAAREKKPLAYTGNIESTATMDEINTATPDEIEETINPSELVAPDKTTDIL